MNLNFYFRIGVGLIMGQFCYSAEEGMKHMPQINAQKTYVIESNQKGEDILDGRGFGDKEPIVRMMNLMMVEGSGYEGMDMANASTKANGNSEMKHAHQMNENEPKLQAKNTAYKFEAKVAPGPAKVGANTIVIVIRDLKTGEPTHGLKPTAQVYMTSMDMGTETPRVREVAPGEYQVKATFSMKGPWAIKLSLPSEESVINFDVQGGN